VSMSVFGPVGMLLFVALVALICIGWVFCSVIVLLDTAKREWRLEREARERQGFKKFWGYDLSVREQAERDNEAWDFVRKHPNGWGYYVPPLVCEPEPPPLRYVSTGFGHFTNRPR